MKVLLLMTSHFSFHEMIKKNLESLGYEVVYFDVKPFKYKNSGQKILNFVKKIANKNSDYKEKLKEKNMENDMFSKLNFPSNYFDFCLVIRPDIYNAKVTHHLKKISKKLFAYQWDGFSRFENSDELIHSFDVFGIFDEKDFSDNIVKYPNLYLTHNFYFDFVDRDTQKKLDISYIGTFDHERLKLAKHFSQVAQKLNLKSYLKLFVNNFKKKINKIEDKIIIDNKMMTYKEMLEISSSSKIILDFKYPDHNGWSFRFFEALYFSQKVVTNNSTITNADFYNENNTLIFSNLDEINEVSLNEFLNREYIKVPENMMEKYSFTNWWKRISEYEPQKKN